MRALHHEQKATEIKCYIYLQ